MAGSAAPRASDHEARFQILANALPVMVWEADAAGRVIWLSESWPRYCGTGTASLLNEGWLAAVHPEERRGWREGWQKAIRDAGGHTRRLRIHRARDGMWRWHLMQTEPLRAADGTVTTWVGSATDVHDLVQAESAAHVYLQEANRSLEQRVQEEILAREAAQKSARHGQHMQAVGQLAGGVAHEFNNILQAVQGSASLIDSRAADPSVVRRFARIILTASERGGTITSRLLSFAQQARFESERIEPATMLGDLAEVLAHTLGAGINVRVEHQPGLPPIVADKVQLETALVNLATNARDAMPNGGTLTLAALAETVAPGQPWGGPRDSLVPGRYVRLTTSDTGTGMDAAVLAHAADPFFTTKGPGGGTGLGLSMAKGFAEQSGGALAIESELGEGTTVTLWLPAADDPADVTGDPARGRQQARAGKRVMLVDDEELVSETLAFSLEDAGFAVDRAASGAEALAMLRAGVVPDVLLSDFSMPGMDGITLIREALALRPGLPAALLTGYAPTDARLAAAGVLPETCPVLRKPITPQQIVGALRALLRQDEGALQHQG
ncbi:MAG TPA: ATP-binding protein [Rhodopila sp.]|nr:ATP-binding protein [Rhodopila sp.]